MDKMRFLKVLSIKMGVFMDKIEFFPIDAGSRGGGSAAPSAARTRAGAARGSEGSAAPGAARTRAGAAREAEREAGKVTGTGVAGTGVTGTS